MELQSSTPDRIGGFRIVRRLATGGTSDVLLARAEGPHGFERPVVLKLLLAQYRDDASFERMFAREAAAYARLSHPAIVKLYDFFALDQQLVMVLEYVEGLPLNKLRALLSAKSRSLDDAPALFVASRIFSALAAAHAARDETGEYAPVIHRDVNPSNVLIPWDGHVKLADFGIAKVAGLQSDTMAGYIKGTYGYMAPEQVRGDPVTPRADVYAATLLLWEFLTKRKAIQRGALPEIEVMRAMAEPSFPSIDVIRSDLPAELRDVMRRGLEPNPDKRAIFADEILNVLRNVANLDEGRLNLVEAVSDVRPPSVGEEAASTQRPAAVPRPGLAALTVQEMPPPSTEGGPQTPLDPDESRGDFPDLSADDTLVKLPAIAMDTEPPATPPIRKLVPMAPPRPTSSQKPAPPAATLPSKAAPASPAAPQVAPAAQAAPRVVPPPLPKLVPPPPPPPTPLSLAATLAARPPLAPPPPVVAPPVEQSAPASRKLSPITPLPPVVSPARPAPPPAEPPPPPPAEPFFDRTLPLTTKAPVLASNQAGGRDSGRVAVSGAAFIAPRSDPFVSPPPAPAAAPRPNVLTSEHTFSMAGMSGASSNGAAAIYAPPRPDATGSLPRRAPAADSRGRGWALGASISFLVSAVGVGWFVYARFIHFDGAQPVMVSRPAVHGSAAVSVLSSTPPAASASPATSSSTLPSTLPSTSSSVSAAAPPSSSSSTSASPSAPIATSTSSPASTSSSAASSSTDPTMGTLNTSRARPDHRVFYDGRVIGQTPGVFEVKCGAHNVKLGSSGTSQVVTIPCGGELSVP